MYSINLFKNYSYLIRLGAKKKKKLSRNNYTKKCINIQWTRFPNLYTWNNSWWFDIPLKSINRSLFFFSFCSLFLLFSISLFSFFLTFLFISHFIRSLIIFFLSSLFPLFPFRFLFLTPFSISFSFPSESLFK